MSLSDKMEERFMRKFLPPWKPSKPSAAWYRGKLHRAYPSKHRERSAIRWRVALRLKESK